MYLANNNSLYGGTAVEGQEAAFYGQNYGWGRDIFGKMNWIDFTFALLGFPLSAICDGLNLQDAYEEAYAEAKRRGEPFYVVGHSGGNLTSGYATGYFNLRHGYGSVTHRTTVNGADAMGNWGTTFSLMTGTKTTSYYNATDPVSWFGSTHDAINPFTAILDPAKNMEAFDLYFWMDNKAKGKEDFFGHNGAGKLFMTNNSLGGQIKANYFNTTRWEKLGYGFLYIHSQPYHWAVEQVRSVTDWYDDLPYGVRLGNALLKGEIMDITRTLYEGISRWFK